MMSRVKEPSTASVRNAPPTAISAEPIISVSVAGPGHADARRVGRLRVLAHGPDGQTERRPAQQPPGRRRHQQERDVRQTVLLRDDAHITEAGQRVPLLHGRDPGALGAGQQQSVGELGQADERDGQAQARHMLVGAQGHGQETHHGARRDAHQDRRGEADERLAGPECHRESGEGPAYMVPSMPRLRMPERSVMVSPVVP